MVLKRWLLGAVTVASSWGLGVGIVPTQKLIVIDEARAAESKPAWSERVEEFGHSVQNRPLRAYILENDTPVDTDDVTLIYAAVHGNETSTPGVIESLRAHLKRHPGNLLGRRVILVPVLNPDGLARKSRRNAHNVDINRNYPGTWRRPRRGEVFKPGSGPASEPETQGMIALVNKYRPRKLVSIHQPLNCMIPSGALGGELARAMQRENKYAIHEDAGYPTPGGFGGYCERILDAPIVTLELPWQSAEAGWKRNATVRCWRRLNGCRRLRETTVRLQVLAGQLRASQIVCISLV